MARTRGGGTSSLTRPRSPADTAASPTIDPRVRRMRGIVTSLRVTLKMLRHNKDTLVWLLKDVWMAYRKENKLGIEEIRDPISRVECELQKLIDEPEKALGKDIARFDKVKATEMSEEQIHALQVDCKKLLQTAKLIEKRFNELFKMYKEIPTKENED